MKTNFNILFSAVLLLFFMSCKNEAKQDQPNASKEVEKADKSRTGQAFIADDGSKPNVLQIAIGSKYHTTLVAAVQAADLENSLVNAGPLMVFAPTNDAFAALPEGTVENLLLPENKDALINILYYHAAPGEYKGKMLRDGMNMYEANGDNVKIEMDGEQVKVNGANIIATVEASNGVIHVIDQVLLPPEK